MTIINDAMARINRRAERYQREDLIKTFVDIGPLFTLLKNSDHQILYGRRGTGKTHVLGYLENYVSHNGNCTVHVDLRTVGSAGGLYADPQVPLSRRATRLLCDVLSEIHESILTFVIKGDTYNLAEVGPLLDGLADSITEVKVIGTTDVETTNEVREKGMNSAGLDISDKAAINIQTSYENENVGKNRKLESGIQNLRVHIPSIQSYFRKIASILNPAEIWVILDEWAEVPLEIQPYLADMLRRSLFPVLGITVKIGSIEHRSNFRISKTANDYIGIEVGADVTSLNLDELMVFDNNEDMAIEFYKKLLLNHINSQLTDKQKLDDADSLVSRAFTQSNVFVELVRASEGVPRDAINILANAAVKADEDKISVSNIRDSARIWYNRDKEKSVSTNSGAIELLRWIVDEVIGHRIARAFLLRSDAKSDLIDFLYDSRVIHIIKQSISGKDEPGVRYDVYTIDYGCYVDLINTTKAPRGLFSVETENGGETYVNVPQNDYRAIRRAILDLRNFESVHEKNKL